MIRKLVLALLALVLAPLALHLSGRKLGFVLIAALVWVVSLVLFFAVFAGPGFLLFAALSLVSALAILFGPRRRKSGLSS